VTEKGPVTTSRLLIQKAIPSDTGLYTCDPSNANPASVRVHILNGKEATYNGSVALTEVRMSENGLHSTALECDGEEVTGGQRS
jgi:hypothetical protein